MSNFSQRLKTCSLLCFPPVTRTRTTATPPPHPKKNYEMYNRSARALFSNKCLSQVIFNKSQTNLNRVLISVNLKLIQCISCYLSLCHNFGLSGSIIKYLLSSINQQMDQVLLDRSRAYVTSPDFRLNYFFLR